MKQKKLPKTLEEFKDKWCQHPQFRTPFENPVIIDNNVWGTVLYRNKQYQVQLFVVKPNTAIPPHWHPDVDSFEVYISGDIEFNVEGHTYLQMNEHEENEGLNKSFGRCLRVFPQSVHSAIIGNKGGTFLSIQKWRDGIKPSNVGDSWEFESNFYRDRNLSISDIFQTKIKEIKYAS